MQIGKRKECERFYVSTFSSRDPETNRGLRVQLTGKQENELRRRVEDMIRFGTLPPARYRITFQKYGQILWNRRAGIRGGKNPGTALKDMTALFGKRDVIRSSDPERVRQMIRELDQAELSFARKKAVWNLICEIGRDCRQRHLIMVNTFGTKKIRGGSKKEIDVLNEEEVKVILQDAENGKDTADEFLGFCITSCVRLAEGVAITAEDIGHEGRKAVIHRQIRESRNGHGVRYEVVEHTKTNKKREIDLFSVGAKIANRRRQAMKDEGSLIQEGAGQLIPGEHLLFTDENGHPLSRKLIAERLREKLAGMPHADCTPGILRRTALTLYYRKTGSRIGVQQQSGDDFAVLCRHYLKVKEELIEMERRLSGIISSMICRGDLHRIEVEGIGELGGLLAGRPV